MTDISTLKMVIKGGEVGINSKRILNTKQIERDYRLPTAKSNT